MKSGGRATAPDRARLEVGVMRAIKQALDPLDVVNPGKMLPET